MLHCGKTSVAPAQNPSYGAQLKIIRGSCIKIVHPRSRQQEAATRIHRLSGSTKKTSARRHAEPAPIVGGCPAQRSAPSAPRHRRGAQDRLRQHRGRRLLPDERGRALPAPPHATSSPSAARSSRSSSRCSGTAPPSTNMPSTSARSGSRRRSSSISTPDRCRIRPGAC